MERLTKIVHQMRKNFAITKQKFINAAPPVLVTQHTVKTHFGQTRLLAYRACKLDTSLPAYFNLHGGGFIMGSPEDDDVWCRKIASKVKCLIISIDYKLSPEYKFPYALEECLAVIKYLVNNFQEINPNLLAIGGQSAGANLAASICLLTKQTRDLNFLLQVLNYPPLDMTIDPLSKPQHDTILNARLETIFHSCYLKDPAEASNPLVSPLLAADLTNLPQALIIAAEHDPLCPEAKAYANKLNAAGVKASYHLFKDCMHAFTHFGPIEAAESANTLVCDKLNEVLKR